MIACVPAVAGAATACAGRDLMADVPPARMAEMQAAADAVPFSKGLFWQAKKGEARIILAGTYHFGDDRHDAAVTRLRPVIARAGALLVEAGPKEEARLAEERKTAGNNPAAREAAALKGLVVMYETMKPKDAARVFDKLPEDVLAPVVRQIAPRKMAEILAAMSADTAQKLTVALARPAVASAAEAPVGPGLPPGELQAIEPPKAARATN